MYADETGTCQPDSLHPVAQGQFLKRIESGSRTFWLSKRGVTRNGECRTDKARLHDDIGTGHVGAVIGHRRVLVAVNDPPGDGCLVLFQERL